MEELSKHSKSTEEKRPSVVNKEFHRLPKEELELLFGWGARRAKQTQRYYLRAVRELLAETPNKILATLDARDLIRFFARRDDLKASSQNILRAAFSSLFNYLNKVGYVERNPALGVSRLKSPVGLHSKVLTVEEIGEMICREPNERNRKIIMLLYFSGMRVSELSNLKWKNVEYSANGTVKLLILGKGSKVRVVYLDAKSRTDSLPERKGPGYLFENRNGSKLSTSQIFRIVQAAGRRARLGKDVSPHWLRHSNATHALENGAPINVVQKTLGHESLSTTGKYLDGISVVSSASFLKLGESL